MDISLYFASPLQSFAAAVCDGQHFLAALQRWNLPRSKQVGVGYRAGPTLREKRSLDSVLIIALALATVALLLLVAHRDAVRLPGPLLPDLRFVRVLAPVALRQDVEEDDKLDRRGQELDPIDVVDRALQEFKFSIHDVRKADENDEPHNANRHRHLDAEREQRSQNRPALRSDHAGADLHVDAGNERTHHSPP